MAAPNQEKQSVSASFYALVACLVVALPASVSSLVGGRDSDARAPSASTSENSSVRSSELQARVVAWLRHELDRESESSEPSNEVAQARPLQQFLEAAEAGRIELLGPSIEVIEALDYGRRESLGALEIPGIGRVVFFPRRG